MSSTARNPFDQFDAPAENPFDQFDPVAQPEAATFAPQQAAPQQPQQAAPRPPELAARNPPPVPLSLGERVFGNFQEGFSHSLMGAVGNYLDTVNQEQIAKNLDEQGQTEAAARIRASIGVPQPSQQRFAQGDAWNAPGTTLGEKLVRGAGSLVGQLGGMSMSPEGLFNKVPGLTETLAPLAERGLAKVTALVPRAAPVLERVAPAVGRTAEAAATQGTVFGAVNPVVQAADIGAGKQKDFDPMQVVESAVMGAALGGLIHGGGEALGAAKTAVGNAFQDWRIKRALAEHVDPATYGPPTEAEAAAFAASPQGLAVRHQFEPKAETPLPPPPEYRPQEPQAAAPTKPVYRRPEPQAAPVADANARVEPQAAVPVPEPPRVEPAPAEPAPVEAAPAPAPQRFDMRGRPITEPAPEAAPATEAPPAEVAPVAEAAAQPEPKTAPEAQPNPKGWETNPITDRTEAAAPKVEEAAPVSKEEAPAAPPAKAAEAPAPKEEAAAPVPQEKVGKITVADRTELGDGAVRTIYADEHGRDIGYSDHTPGSGEAPEIHVASESRREGYSAQIKEHLAANEGVKSAPAEAPAKVAKVKVTGKSHTKAQPIDEATGHYPVTDTGHVQSERGTPLKFAEKKQAEAWMDKRGTATADADQAFKLVKHPTERGKYSVQQREPVATKEPPSDGAGVGAKTEAATVPGKPLPSEAHGRQTPEERAAFHDENFKAVQKQEPNLTREQYDARVKGGNEAFGRMLQSDKPPSPADHATEQAKIDTEAQTALEGTPHADKYTAAPERDAATPAADLRTEQRAIDQAASTAKVEGYDAADESPAASDAGQTGQRGAAEEAGATREADARPSQSGGDATGTGGPGDATPTEKQSGAARGETGSVEQERGTGTERTGGETDSGPGQSGPEEPAGRTRKGRARQEPADVNTPKGKKKKAEAEAVERASDVEDATDAAELEAAQEASKDAPGGTPKEKVAANLRTRNEFYASPAFNPQAWRDLGDTLVKVFGWTTKGAKAWIDEWSRNFSEMEFGLPKGNTLREKMNNLTRPIRATAELFLKDKDGVLRGEAIAHRSPVMRKVADLFFAATEGVGKHVTGVKSEDYFSAKYRWENKWKDRYSAATQFARKIKDKAARDQAMEQIGKLVQNPKNIVRGTPMGDAAYEITQIFKEAHAYLREAGVPVGTVREGYLPRIENVEKILADPAEFEARATRAYIASGYGAKKAATAAKEWLNRVTLGDYGLKPDGSLIEGGGTTPSNFTKSRTISKAGDAIMDDMYYQNVDDVVPGYIHQAVGRAEWARRFGPRDRATATPPKGLTAKQTAAWFEDGNGKWKDFLAELRAEGNGALSGDFGANVRAMTGSIGPAGNYGGFKRGAVWMRTINILGKLGYSVLSSLAEPITHAVQTGNTLDAMRGYIGLVHHWVPGLKKLGNGQYLSDLAADLNIIGNHWDESTALGLSGGNSGSKSADKLVSKFFKITGQTQFTEASRKTAVGIGQVFFRRLAKDIESNGMFQGVARKILTDFGVRDTDGFARYISSLDNPTAADMFAGGQHGEDYASALRRYVQRTVMHPTGAMKPYYADHPLGSLVFSLTSFNYAFKKQVLDRAVKMAKDAGDITIPGVRVGNDLNWAERAYALTPALNLFPMAMASFAISEVRDELLPDPSKDPDKPMDDGTKWVRAISRMGGFGYADPIVNAYAQARYTTDVATAAAGAILGPMGTALGAGMDYSKEQLFPDPDAEETDTKGRKAMASAWDVVVRPTLQTLIVSGAPAGGVGSMVAARGLSYWLADRRTRAGFVDLAGEKDE